MTTILCLGSFVIISSLAYKCFISITCLIDGGLVHITNLLNSTHILLGKGSSGRKY
nr:hypothetical protein [Hymenobacter sp. DG25B]